MFSFDSHALPPLFSIIISIYLKSLIVRNSSWYPGRFLVFKMPSCSTVTIQTVSLLVISAGSLSMINLHATASLQPKALITFFTVIKCGFPLPESVCKGFPDSTRFFWPPPACHAFWPDGKVRHHPCRSKRFLFQ